MTNPTWSDALDAFEARLDAQVEALGAGGGDVLDAFTAPELPAPLPPDLADRAAALLRRCHDVEDALRAALAGASDALDGVAGERATKRHSQPVYFDSRV